MSVDSSKNGVPVSILDTDLYKLTMQQAVLRHFPNLQATYRFTHRDKDVFFTRECFNRFKAAIQEFSRLALTAEERDWLQHTCPYFSREYVDYLSKYRFNPDQVEMTFVPASDDGERGRVEIQASGPWEETIFWEVPLMSCLSELYFTTVDTDWTYDGQSESAYQKAKTLLEADCTFSEFGTRRRRSFHLQDLVVGALLKATTDLPGKGRVSGTSNVHLARKHGIMPVGTIAHEWFMGVAALKGYENANCLALDLWEQVYHKSLLIALTDTFSTKAFFRDLKADPERAKRWTGLRQDSGDPLAFAPQTKAMYESIGIDPRTKSIIYSDSLNVDKALALKKQCSELGFSVSFGIGTFLTNDFTSASSGGAHKSRALNMVIKLSSVNDRPCVKISDDLNKNTGDPATVQKVKEMYGLLE